MSYTRREFGKFAVASLPVALAVGSEFALADAQQRPNSKWAGIQVGLNVPYSFGTRTAMTAEDILAKCIALNVSGVELRAQAIEKSLGVPDELVLGPAPSDYIAAGTKPGQIPGIAPYSPPAAPVGGASGSGRGGNGMPRTLEEIAAYNAAAKKLGEWRKMVPMSKAGELRKKYEESGVFINIVKFDGISDLSDEELDYSFTLARTLGATAVSGEFSIPATKRLVEAADRNKMFVGFHGHVAVTPEMWEKAFSYGKYAGANVDIGHYIAGNNTSPLPFIERYHERVTHLHVKDRKFDLGPNVEFGTGDTPIKEVLQTIRDKKWQIPAIIEFEIPLPAGTDRTPEIAKCVEYCKECLLS
jgi:sugar phosphate isomerase/epimerase